MPKRSNLPPTASVADAIGGQRLHAPSAARNARPIGDLLTKVAPERGRVLELASGTGQHVVAFAARLPGLDWSPTEIDPARRRSIDAYAAQAGLSNIAPARDLDATTPGWGADWAGQSLIQVANLVHLISMPELQTLIAEAATALAPGGRFVIYSPFKRAGKLTSDGDAAFHASLIAHDPDIGYKNDIDTLDLLRNAGLEIVSVIDMPANNLALVSEKPDR